MPRASGGSQGGVDAEAGEAWGRPLCYPGGDLGYPGGDLGYPGGDLGCGPCPLPSPGPGLRDAPRPHLLRITPGHLLPAPLQTEKDLSPLNIQTFFVFIFFQGRSNIFQMRQNRDRSEAFSAGACVSAGRGFRLGLRAFLPTALSFPSFCLGISNSAFGPAPWAVPSLCLGITPSVSPYASPDLSLPLSPRPVPPSSLSLRSLFVRLQVPGPKQTFRSSRRIGNCRTTRGVAVPRVLPRPPRPGAPAQLGPAGRTRSHLVSQARAAVAAAIYARLGRGWSFKRRFPGAPRGPTRSPMARVAANHAPLPPPPPPRPAGAAERLSA